MKVKLFTPASVNFGSARSLRDATLTRGHVTVRLCTVGEYLDKEA